MSAKKKRLAVLATLLAAAATVALLARPPVGKYLYSLAETVDAAGAWGPFLLAGAYVLATLLFVPASLLTMLAGLLFGVVKGTMVASLASLTGASASFWLGRTIAHDWVQHKMAGSPRFQAIDAAVNRQGFRILFLIRLSPVFPYLFTNYAMSLTKIRFRDFLFASWMGMLPGTILYAYLGSTAQSIAEIATGSYRRGRGQTIVYLFGLLATVVVTVLVARMARSAVRDAADLTPSADE
jgi:uncharacterized membrane protein YdjX (TVP38/TMEM64 family)